MKNIIIILGLLFLVKPIPATDSPTKEFIEIDEHNIRAGYLENLVVVDLPITNHTTGNIIAKINIRIIDYMDSIIGEKHSVVVVNPGVNKYKSEVPVKLPLSKIFAARLSYEVSTKQNNYRGVIALSEIFRLMETLLIGPREFYAGTKVGYHVMVRDLTSQNTISGVILTGFLIADKDTNFVCDGVTDNDGSAFLFFDAPDSAGSYNFQVKSSSSHAIDNIMERVTVKKGSQIYLVTDKPIYQPDQTIYIRALALSRFRLKPLIDREAKIQVYDARDNRVFRLTARTDSFGVVAANFQLADEINYGNYKIEAVIGNDNQSKTVEVKPYVLPKFKLDMTTENEFYKPGEKVKGKLSAEYFFGKTVALAKVQIKAYKYDVSWTEFSKIDGSTDKNGSFEYSFNLPGYFVGQPFEQGQARVRIDASVTDGANHEEKVTKSVVITKNDIVITVFPESDRFLAGMENTFFIFTTYPNGNPAQTELHLHVKKGSISKSLLKTDRLGICEITVKPDSKQDIAFSIQAFDITGNQAKTDYALNIADKISQIRITADRTIYKTADMARISIFSSFNKMPVFIDIIKQGQVIGSRTMDLADGRINFDLDLSPDYTGLLQFCAYIVQPTGQIIRDVKTVFVDPVSDLIIKAEPDKKSYLPGAEARVDFLVTDKKSEPVITCLGISIVDEAVFALSEMQPGLEKVYFMLEKELLTPRYEIHGFQPVDLVRFEEEKYNYNTDDVESRERAGKILLSQISIKNIDQIEDNTANKNSPNDYELLRMAQNRVYSDLAVIVTFLFDYPWDLTRTIKKNDINKALRTLDPDKLIDPWGNSYETIITKENDEWRLSIKTAGPDEKYGSDDDILTRSAGCITRIQIDYGDLEPIMEVYREATSRFGRVTGVVLDVETNEPLIGANVVIDMTELGAATTEKGEFIIPYVPPGYYTITASYLGYNTFTIKDVLVMAGYRTDFRFRIKPTVIQVMAVTAIARREPIVMSQTQTGRAVTLNEMTRLPVIALQKGVGIGEEEPRVRKYFPETFLFEPSLITNEEGKAQLSFMMPDNITTWRMSMMGSSKDGRMGSQTKPLLVFKDFFIDLDLPVSLTCNDEISLPVAVYNYLKETMTIRIEITREEWFDLLDDQVKEMTIKKEDVGVVYFRIRARDFGEHKLLVKGYTKGNSDAIQKKVTVIPDGKRENTIVSGRLGKDIEQNLDFPVGTITGTQKILVRFYPGILSQLTDGLDGLLKMPFGCFEQTTSITYPNVLILNFLRKAEKRKPEIEIQALQYIATGYQRLLCYETPQGGFSWWGNAPGNKLLTAYGLMEFNDMKQVFDVDERVIERTVQWFLKQQENTGAWSLDPSYLHEEVWGKFKNAEILPTAFITWALLETGYKNKEIDKSLDYLKRHCWDVEDPYALALVVNALALNDPNDKNLEMLLIKLINMRTEEDDKVHWTSGISSMTNSHGSGADIETSSLITLALIRSGRNPEIVTKAINYLNASKSPRGGWCTTQGTVFALKALLESAKMMTDKTDAVINIILNGEKISDLKITPDQSDIVRIVELKDNVELNDNTLRLEIRGRGSLLYDIITDYYRSWETVPGPVKPILTIEQEFDKTSMQKDDVIACRVKATNQSNANLQMVILDLGIPPGFDVIENDLADLVAKKTVQKYHLTPRQIIIYFDNIPAQKSIDLVYHMKAKFPLKVKSGYSQIYDYYNPDRVGLIQPVEFEVK